MSRIAWHRAARIPVPSLPTERVIIAAPPQLPAPSPGGAWLMTVLPLMSSVSIGAYMLTYGKALLTVLAIAIIVVSVVITVAVRVQLRSATRNSTDRQRERYLEHLASVRESARAVARLQRAAAVWQWPSPERLMAIAQRRRRVWERRPADPDFLQIRVGTGPGPLATPLQLSLRNDPGAEYDPVLEAAATRLTESSGLVRSQPATVLLRQAGVMSLVGAPTVTRPACRAMLSQIAVLHAPDDVLVMVSAGGADAEWDWATWLPHARDEPSAGDSAPALVASDYPGLEDAVERELSRALAERSRRRGSLAGRDREPPSRRVVIVIDSFQPSSPWATTPLARQLIDAAGPDTGISVVALVRETAHEPSRVDVRASIGDEGRLVLQADRQELLGPVREAEADLCPVEVSEATARSLAPLLLSEERSEALARTVPLAALLGITDLDGFDPRGTWRGPADDKLLRVPLGIGGNGEYVELDLRESAQDGMGPHGLIVGATGSGKSELLRTLLTGLTVTHPPELLSMVLVDFKGGATFAGMTGLPHVAGLITNLADDLGLVDRVRDALAGEQQRRQRLLRDAGNVDSVREYQARQAAGGVDSYGRPLEPLPYLLVIVDEFGELLSLRPDLINLFVQIGRVGRSLGIHLILATQRLEESRLRGLESHLSFRICLRTFSVGESRAVIGTPDAYFLPPLPGSAYLRVTESLYERFRVAHVSAPFGEPGSEQAAEADPSAEVISLGLREAPQVTPEDRAGPPRRAPVPVPGGATAAPGGRTQMQAMIGQLERFGRPVHKVWLPPLQPMIPLDALLGPLSVQDDRGLQSGTWPECGSLRFPVGVVDLPLTQKQSALSIDFSQTDPHMLLVGASQSGKSTFLRTMLMAAMLTHTPREVQFYCLDYGGGTLHSLDGAPHLSCVVARGDAVRAMRAFTEVQRVITEREQLFRSNGLHSVADLRELRDTDDTVFAPDVFLVVDGWGVLRNELTEADFPALDIAARGPGVGVHLVISARRWGDIRMSLRDSVSTRLELGSTTRRNPR